MRSLFTITALALSAGLRVSGQVNTAAQLVSSLKTAPTANDRLNLLSQDTDFVFNFNNGTATKGAGGQTVGASVSNFPVLTNQGLAMTVGWLDYRPCGMNTPHTHPRATEMLYLVNGSIATGMLDENGARFVYNTVNAGSAAVFLKGSIHYQLNLGCDPVQFVAALNDEDPGTLSVAQRYFGLPPDIIGASLGDLGVQEVAGLEAKIPDNIALGTDQCLQKCGINRTNQPTNQRQPRVSANALPSGSSGPAPAAPAPTASATAHARRAMMEAAVERRAVEAATTPVTVAAELQVVGAAGQFVNLALVGLVAMMAIGYVGIALFYVRNRAPVQYAAAAAPVMQRYIDHPQLAASEKAAL